MKSRCRVVVLVALFVYLIGTPPAQATYTQQFLLAQDATFQGQVMVAMLSAAVSIMAEANTTAGHLQRVTFANAVLRDPTKYQPTMSFVVAAQSATPMTPLTVPSIVADSLIQTAVNGVWDGMANHYAN